jgi:hypothetical protein
MACCRLGRHTAPEFVGKLEDWQADSNDDVARLEPSLDRWEEESGLGQAESWEEAAAEPYLGTVGLWVMRQSLEPVAE